MMRILDFSMSKDDDDARKLLGVKENTSAEEIIEAYNQRVDEVRRRFVTANMRERGELNQLFDALAYALSRLIPDFPDGLRVGEVVAGRDATPLHWQYVFTNRVGNGPQIETEEEQSAIAA